MRALNMLAVSIGMMAVAGCINKEVIRSDGQGFASIPSTQRVSIRLYETRSIRVHTPGNAVGAGLIDDFTRPDGSDMKIPSPSYLVAQSLRTRLGKFVPSGLEPVPNEITRLAQDNNPPAPGRHTLDVRTLSNFLGYRPLAWQTYQYLVLVQARLVAPDGTVLWQNHCQVGGGGEDTTLQLHRLDFKVNDGQRLKDIMALAADRCAESLASGLSGGKL